VTERSETIGSSPTNPTQTAAEWLRFFVLCHVDIAEAPQPCAASGGNSKAEVLVTERSETIGSSPTNPTQTAAYKGCGFSLAYCK